MNKTKEVSVFLNTLDYKLMDVVEELRSVILTSNKDITEHIKWNAPSFCKKGQDRVTMNLKSEKFVQIIFHRGAKVNNSEFKFEDKSGLLTWLSADRAIVKFSNVQEVEEKKGLLKEVINKWIELT